ncbi:MAG TPA: isoprenylcysteine carboxylmethyltransferase family protein [Nannocystis sp.]
MSHPLLAFLLFLLYAGLVFGLRTFQHLRRTGNTGFRGLSGRPGSLEWLGGALFVVALVLAALGPLAEWLGLVAPLVAVPAVLADLAVLLVLLGTAATLAAQAAMGAAWRIGVQAGERTELVTGGPFALVRNPVFSAMLVTGAGLLLLAPNLLALAGFFALLAAVELQVRFVEEPHLVRIHGERYRAYARRVGRFFPGLGTMP